MTATVSILMPVYNAASTLEAAVSCIMGQKHENWELLLINDGSTDKSGEICDKLAGEDSRIRVIHQENRGAGAARNRGLAAARGEFVLMLDADDTFDPDMLERGLAALQNYGVHTVVWGLTEHVIRKRGPLAPPVAVVLPAAVWRTAERVHRELLRLEAHTLFGYCCNKLYRREVLVAENIVMPQEPLYEDFLFNAAYAPHITSLAVLPTAPVHYLKRGAGLTARFVPDYFPLSQKRVQTMWDLCREWGIADGETRRVLGDIYVRYILSALARNCHRRAGMTHAARRVFLKGVYTHPLFLELVPYAAPAGRAGVLCRLLQGRRVEWCLAAGRVIHWVKTGLPGLFSRMSKGEGQ